MATKKKRTTENVADEVHVNETDSSEKVQSESVADVPPSAPSRILTESEAMDFVKQNYVVPQGNKFVFVTEDKNVFWEYGENSATVYAHQKNLKLFKLAWH